MVRFLKQQRSESAVEGKEPMMPYTERRYVEVRKVQPRKKTSQRRYDRSRRQCHVAGTSQLPPNPLPGTKRQQQALCRNAQHAFSFTERRSDDREVV